jgi:uncharacterized protein (DUF1697 family)
MIRTVAFLRAVNVGGRSVVSMDSLRRAFAEAGAGEAATYIQTGNVVFDVPEDGREAFFDRIAEAVGDLLGGEATLIYRPLEDLAALVKRPPFDGVAPGPDVKRYVAFLSRRAVFRPALPLVREKDGLEIVGTRGPDVFLLSRRVGGRFGFPNLLVEKAYGVPATTRNWNTLEGLVAKFG